MTANTLYSDFIDAADVSGNLKKSRVNLDYISAWAGGLVRYDLLSSLIALYVNVGGVSDSHKINILNPSQYQFTYKPEATHDANGVKFNIWHTAPWNPRTLGINTANFSYGSTMFGTKTGTTTDMSIIGSSGINQANSFLPFFRFFWNGSVLCAVDNVGQFVNGVSGIFGAGQIVATHNDVVINSNSLSTWKLNLSCADKAVFGARSNNFQAGEIQLIGGSDYRFVGTETNGSPNSITSIWFGYGMSNDKAEKLAMLQRYCQRIKNRI